MSKWSTISASYEEGFKLIAFDLELSVGGAIGSVSSGQFRANLDISSPGSPVMKFN